MDPTHPAHAEEFQVEIVPGDMVAGIDADGLPRTDPPEPVTAPAPTTPQPDAAAEKARKDQEALVKALQQERDQRLAEARAEREARENTEREAQTRIEAERRAREAAEQDAAKYTTIASRAHWTTLHTRKEQFEAGASNARGMIAAIKRDIKTASEAGDHERLAELQEQMAEAVSYRQTYDQATSAINEEIEDTRRRFEAMRQTPPPVRETRQADPEPQAPAQKDQQPQAQPQKKVETPEEWIKKAEAVVGEDGGKWLMEHKDYVTDAAKHEHLLTFSKLFAMKHGQAALKTTEFRDALNAEFFPSKSDSEDDDVTEDEAPQAVVEAPKRSAAPAAPVSRGAPARPSGSANKIELTAEQHAIAPELYPAGDYSQFSDAVKKKFPSWSPTAARWQYHEDLQRAQSAGKFSR